MIGVTYFTSHWWHATHSQGALPSDDLILTDCPYLKSGYKQTGGDGSAVDQIMIAESLSFLIKSVNGL